ncbi:MAG: hypothetical protein KA354_13900 [Phycisphaerae bacterium]|nr:hypothetical protein [Phycisphaerae bacterium]
MHRVTELDRRGFLRHMGGAAMASLTASWPQARYAVEAAESRPSSSLPASRGSLSPGRFYVPENPRYTIFDSAADSLRFTLTRCMTTCRGRACSKSSFVDPDAAIMGWHDFGPLEGPGWAANAVGGAYELIRWARFTGKMDMERTALSVIDHVLDNGFIDTGSGLIRGYRHIPTDRIVLNFKHTNDWFCPGSTAKVAVQMLFCSDLDERRRSRLRAAAVAYARWLDAHLKPLANGWFPRRCTPDGSSYPRAAEGGDDAFFATSGDGLFILQLWAEMIDRKLGDYREKLRTGVQAFMRAGGFYASINHDTYDAEENVTCSTAFRVIRRAGQVLGDPALGRFALEKILPRLERFKMSEDRNGLPTTGLLFMEDSWNTSYMWENAEASLAFLEAYSDTGEVRYLTDGLTILRAAAKHHYGPHGFLTEGVDWDDRVGRQHHIDEAKYGAIKYTEPFLNNQHIVEPTLYFLTRCATVRTEDDAKTYRDPEGIVVTRVKL